MDRSIFVSDLDDVLFDFVTPFFEWHNHRYGTDLTPEALASSKYLFPAWDGTPEEAVARVSQFFGEVDILGLEPIPGAAECLEELHAKYDLALVTARDPEYAEVTEAWIEKYFAGVFDRVVLGIGHSERGERSITKADVCRQIGADVLVDDQVGHLAGAAEAGVRTFLFGGYPWNRSQPLPQNTVRVSNWDEVCAALM